MKMIASSAPRLSMPENDLFPGVPLPDLFSGQLLDMPLFSNGGDYIIDDVASESSSQGGTIVEEILDFFVDPTDPSRLLMSRSGSDGPAAVCSLPISKPSSSSTAILPVSSSHSSSARASAVAVVATRKRSLQPCEDEKVSEKRERNRLAAERCRARRVQLISALQSECDELRSERDNLQRENRILLDMLARSGIRIPEISSPCRSH